MSSIRLSLLALVVSLAPSLSHAADPVQSVTATFKQMGVSVEGGFKKFTSQISYDPASIAATKAHVEIETASFDLRNSEYNREVQKSEWFDAAKYPKAVFDTTEIRTSAAGAFEASGNLTIKGKTLPVIVPVKVTQDGSTWWFDGAVPVKRLAFGLGADEWKDTGMIADDVLIKFKLSAPVKK